MDDNESNPKCSSPRSSSPRAASRPDSPLAMFGYSGKSALIFGGKTAPNCQHCGKPVYSTDQVREAGAHWHNKCLRCSNCSKTLRQPEVMGHEKTKQIFCEKCYQQKFSSKYRAYGGEPDKPTEAPPVVERQTSRGRSSPRAKVTRVPSASASSPQNDWWCEKCVLKNPGHANKCEICQTPAPTVEKSEKKIPCRKCAKLLVEDSKFCIYCGVKM